MQKIPRQNVSISSPAGVPESTLQTMEELKLHKGQLLNADLAPLSTKQVMDLIRAVQSSEQLRLNYSDASQRPSYGALHSLLSKSKDLESSNIEETLRTSLSEFSSESAEFMIGALNREREMLDLIQNLLGSVEQIRNKVAGSQGG